MAPKRRQSILVQLFVVCDRKTTLSNPGTPTSAYTRPYTRLRTQLRRGTGWARRSDSTGAVAHPGGVILFRAALLPFFPALVGLGPALDPCGVRLVQG